MENVIRTIYQSVLQSTSQNKSAVLEGKSEKNTEQMKKLREASPFSVPFIRLLTSVLLMNSSCEPLKKRVGMISSYDVAYMQSLKKKRYT